MMFEHLLFWIILLNESLYAVGLAKSNKKVEEDEAMDEFECLDMFAFVVSFDAALKKMVDYFHFLGGWVLLGFMLVFGGGNHQSKSFLMVKVRHLLF